MKLSFEVYLLLLVSARSPEVVEEALVEGPLLHTGILPPNRLDLACDAVENNFGNVTLHGVCSRSERAALAVAPIMARVLAPWNQGGHGAT